jgi:large subunit ribosomal protein L25
MAQIVTLTAERRTATGKGAARKVRFASKVPAVIYGHGRPSESLVLDAKALELALQGVEWGSAVVQLTVGGTTVKALIREIQRHPVRPDILHLDFYEIHADEQVRLKVPVHLVGTPEGVRTQGGVLDQVTRELEIEVLPDHIPDRLEVDVTSVTIGHSLHVRDISVPHATILTPGDLTVATVLAPRAEEVAAPAAEAVAEVAEPELIRKPREEEGEGEAEGEAEGPAKGPVKS